MGISQLEGTMSQYADRGFTQARCGGSAHTAMDGSLDSGYTISMKTQYQKLDLLNEETLQIVGPRRWTVDDRGVLVNADESEVAIKVEKPDWTTETKMADSDCSTIVDGSGDSETKRGKPVVKEASSMCSDYLDMAVDHRIFGGENRHTCTTCGSNLLLPDNMRVHTREYSEVRHYVCGGCGKTLFDTSYRTFTNEPIPVWILPVQPV